MSGIMQIKRVGNRASSSEREPVYAQRTSTLNLAPSHPVHTEPLRRAQDRLRRGAKTFALANRSFRGPRAPRGQAMVEYSLVAHLLLLGGVLLAWPFLVYLVKALSLYFKSIYFVVSSPVP